MWVLLLFLPFIFQPGVAPVDRAEQIITDANVAYMNGDYAAAVELYEMLLDNGVDYPGVYVNLGHAYYHSGALGQALLNYRRAQHDWPRDVELNNAIYRIMAERVDVLGDETGMLESLSATTVNIVTQNELSAVVGAIWAAWFGLLLIAGVPPAWRNKMRLTFLLLSGTLLCGLLLISTRMWVTTQRPVVVILDSSVQVMSGPGNTYLELYTLHEAAEVRVWEKNNGWVKFALPDGRLGWLAVDSIGWVNEF